MMCYFVLLVFVFKRQVLWCFVIFFILIFFILLTLVSCCCSSGWQPRWFVLDNGVISYYDSEDDVGKGSKGSIKMSVCDIKG